MRVVTLNVRNPSFDDGPNAWPYRRKAFYGVLKGLAADVLCLQETTEAHAAETARTLGFAHVFGVAREEGEHAEMCAILTNLSGRSGTEWLCETPEVPGTLGWDARCPRVATWVDFGDCAVLNLHLDHAGLAARTNGMAQTVRRADALGKPCLIVGDLNAPPAEPALALAREAGFVDLAEGTGPTYDGFGGAKAWEGEAADPAVRIDYLLARGDWRCERAWVERDAPPYSDHRAVVADLEPGNGLR